jgi:O-antigen/teichoic acid export membrane protein
VPQVLVLALEALFIDMQTNQPSSLVVPKQLGIVVRGGGIAFVGRFGAAALQYLFMVGLARMYGAGPTGLFAFGLSVVSVISVIGQLGTQETLLRFVAAYRGVHRTRLLSGVLLFGIGLGLTGAMIVAILLRANASLVTQWTGKPAVEPVVRLLALAVPLLAFVNLTASALQGAKRLGRMVSVRELGLQVAVISALAIAWAFGLQFEQFFWLYVICLVALAIYAFWMFWREFGSLFKSSVAEFEISRWLRFSLPLTVVAIFGAAAGWFDRIALGLYQPVEEVGIYFAAQRTGLLVTLVLAAANAVFSPVAADLWQRGDIEQLDRIYKTLTRWVWTLSLPILVAMIVLRQELMGVFGVEFERGSTVLTILLVGIMVNAATGSVGQLLIMTGHQQLVFINSALAAVATIGGLLWMVPRYGMLGAAVVNAAVLTGANLLRLVQVRLVVGIQPYEMNYLRSVGASLGAFFVGWSVYRLAGALSNLAIIVVVSGTIVVTYLVLLFAMGLPTEDRVVLQQLGYRLSGGRVG